jgi:hypothetical protein
MKAFIIDRYGKKAGARIGEMPDPWKKRPPYLWWA